MRGYRGIKYTLFLFCYVFWVVSAVLIAVGVYAKIAKEKDVVDSMWVDPALLLICIGSFMFLLTFLGCSGSLRNSTCLLNTFLSLLLLVLVLQIAAATICFLFTDMVVERTERFMMQAVVGYRDDLDLQNAIDFVQKKFSCCGVQNHHDWNHNAYFACHQDNPSLEACGVPYSCCRRNQTRLSREEFCKRSLRNGAPIVWMDGVTRKIRSTTTETVLNTMCGYGMQNQDEDQDQDSVEAQIFTSGCLDQIRWWMKKNLYLIGGLTAALLILEVSLVSLAAVQVVWIKRVQKRKKKSSLSRRSERIDNIWLPPFADFDQE